MNASLKHGTRRPLLRIVYCLLLVATACSGSANSQPSDNASAQVGGSSSSTVVNGQTETTISNGLEKVGDAQHNVKAVGEDEGGSTSRPGPGKGSGSGSGSATSTPGGSAGGSTTTTTAGQSGPTTTVPGSLPDKGGDNCTWTDATGRSTTGQCCKDASPQQCDAYDLDGARKWQPEASGSHAGKISIEYWTNAAACSFSENKLVEMAEAAIGEWTRGYSNLQAVYRGHSNEAAVMNVYNNVVGCGECTLGIGVACTSVSPYSNKAKFSIVMGTKSMWDTTVCKPNTVNPCTRYSHSGYHGQGVLTHEWAHVICHVKELLHESTRNLTLYGIIVTGGRNVSTLGLGDLLMVRACYGWLPLPATIHND